jgi:integrase
MIDFRYRNQRCREQTKFEDTPANRKKLEKIIERMEAEILLGTFVYRDYFPRSKKVEFFDHLDSRVAAARLSPNQTTSDIPTFKEFTEVWLSDMSVEWRESHKKTVMINLNTYVLPAFGEKRISDITKADILNFRSNLAKDPARKSSELKAATINKIMTPLRMLMTEAADRYEFTCPFRGIKSLKIQKVDVEPFTLEEVRRILDNVRDDFKAYYTVRFFTGMRTAEIDGLKWKYIDFDRRQILIRETVVDGNITYTKTDGSQREIHMSQPVYDALREQQRLTAEHDFVFATRLGTPMAHNNVTKRVWYPLLRYLGIKERRPYQTRHTAATLWLAAGESPEWIARQMGHTSTEMLFRVYSRYVPNLTRQDGSAFDRLLQQRFIVEEQAHNEAEEG